MDRKYFATQIDSYLKESKRYILTERAMSNKEKILKKMAIPYHDSMIEEGLITRGKTNLGRKYKNGDKLLFAFLQESPEPPSQPFGEGHIHAMNIEMIILLEEELGFYELEREDFSEGFGFHVLRPKES